MSIRIQSDGLPGASSPGIGRTDEVSQLSGSTGSPAVKGGHRGADSVNISSLSQSVTAASAAQDVQHATRVKQLAALYRSGQYQVDSNLVSRAMVSQSLGLGENA